MKPWRFRERYWTFTTLAGEIAQLFKPENRDFMQHVLRDYRSYLMGAVRPLAGDPTIHVRAAVEWLLLAQKATSDDGVSFGYFPCRAKGNGWMPSYPETTGYIITTLLAYSEYFADFTVRDAALRMARWEISIQMPSGAVQGGPVCPPSLQTAAVFNTGMVLDGWCSAFRATDEAEFLAAAQRAADFLVSDLDESGYFRTNGAYVSSGEIKTYNCLCAWALHRFGSLSRESRYQDAAIRIIDAALRQQKPNGWFAQNSLDSSYVPLTHTMGYTLQGVLEVGVASQRQDFLSAAMKGVAPLVALVDRHGLLPGRLYADWTPAISSSCLTGNAQIAIVCYRLYELTHTPNYKQVADTLVDSLKALQLLESRNPALIGAIAGSFPPFGNYMRAGYPNWATKYFIDALLLQSRVNSTEEVS